MNAAVRDVMSTHVVAAGRNILAEAWRIEGAVSGRDRLTYPEGISSHV